MQKGESMAIIPGAYQEAGQGSAEATALTAGFGSDFASQELPLLKPWKDSASLGKAFL